MFSDLPFGGSALASARPRRARGRRAAGRSARSSAGCGCPASWMNVTTASTTRITAAPTVQPISRRVLPRICAGDGALAGAELEQRVEQRALDAQEDDDRDDDHEPVERVDVVGVRRAAGLGGDRARRRRSRRRPGGAGRPPRRRARARGDGGASGEGQPRRAAFYSQPGGERAPEGRCSTPAEHGRPPLDERRDALGEVRRARHLLLDGGLELELLRPSARTASR